MPHDLEELVDDVGLHQVERKVAEVKRPDTSSVAVVCAECAYFCRGEVDSVARVEDIQRLGTEGLAYGEQARSDTVQKVTFARQACFLV